MVGGTRSDRPAGKKRMVKKKAETLLKILRQEVRGNPKEPAGTPRKKNQRTSSKDAS